METQILFLLGKVRMANQKRYQKWFAAKWLASAESDSLYLCVCVCVEAVLVVRMLKVLISLLIWLLLHNVGWARVMDVSAAVMRGEGAYGAH